MLNKKQRLLKRIFDLSISIVLIPLLIVPLILLVILATLSTHQFGLFQQQRIGKNGNPFIFFKIRTLKGTSHANWATMQKSETQFGAWLRKTKLDEIPQIFHVLFGSMTMVGPRPDLPGYADKLEGDDRIILSIRPGITGPATIKYKNEDILLSEQTNPDTYNDTVIWPDKVAINKDYVKNWSFWKDVGYLFDSII